VIDRDAWADPPVQVGRERDIAQPGEARGRLLDVVADPEDLLQDHDPRPGAGLGERDVRVELAVSRVYLLNP
jgi:hypothetical protein